MKVQEKRQKRSPDNHPQFAAYLHRVNQEIADEITRSGFAFIMTSKVNGQVVIRLSICSHRTTLPDIEQVFQRLQGIGRTLHQREAGFSSSTGSGADL